MTRISFLCLALLLLCSCYHAEAIQSDSIVATPSSPADSVQPMVEPASEVTSPDSITFAFVGDIMMGTTYPEDGDYLPTHDGKNLFVHVKGILQSADVAAGNLEGTLLDGEGVVKKCGDPSLCYAFRMPARYVAHLTDAGFDLLSIANNHINDFGSPGLSSTQQTLADAEIAYAGLRASCPTAIIERGGRKIGFAAFGHNRGTLSIMDMQGVKRTVEGLKRDCDIVVVSFHGGGEGAGFSHVPHEMETCFGEKRGNVEAFAHAAIDAGADVVYGHGPHVTRAMELYNERLIIYSLGNFCTPYRVNLAGVSGYAPVVTVTLNADGTLRNGRIHSFIQQKGCGPQPDCSGIVAKHIRSLTLSDFPKTSLKISTDGVIMPK